MKNRRRFKNPCRSVAADYLCRYSEIREKGGKRSQEVLDVIDKVLEELKQEPDGDIKFKAIEMMYIKKTHKVIGIARELHIGSRTVQRYLNDVIDRICENAELIK